MVMILEQGHHAQVSSAFPEQLGFFHSSPTQGSCSRNALLDFIRTRHRLHSSGQGCTPILQDKHMHSFLYQNYTRVSFRLAPMALAPGSRVDWRRRNLLTARPSLLVHALGLTLVTHGIACVPLARVPPTTWEITCPSKRT